MKLQRLSDKKMFAAFGINPDRNRPSIPVALLGQVQPVDDVNGDVWVFNADGRHHAAPGDCVVFDGPFIIAVLKADTEPEGWRPVAETQKR